MKRLLIVSLSLALVGGSATACSNAGASEGGVATASESQGWTPGQPVRHAADVQRWYLTHGISQVAHPTSVEVKRQRWSAFLAAANADIGGRPLSDAPADNAFMYVLVMHGPASLGVEGPDVPKLDYQWVATTVNESSGLSGMTFAMPGGPEPSWFPGMASLQDPS